MDFIFYLPFDFHSYCSVFLPNFIVALLTFQKKAIQVAVIFHNFEVNDVFICFCLTVK